MSTLVTIKTPISDLDNTRTESFAEWMHLHKLNIQTVEKYMNVAREYSKTRLLSDTRYENLKNLQLDAKNVWNLTAAAMMWFFPSRHRVLEEVRDNAQLTINEDSVMSDCSYTYYHDKTRTLMVELSYKYRPEDVLTVAHEFGHCVQLTSTKENFIPPLFRETCAFIAELIFLKYLERSYPELHTVLVKSWYSQNSHYLGQSSKMLHAATNISLQPYTYEWNYPIARVFSIIAFNSMGNKKIWELFSNFELILEKIFCFSEFKSHEISLNLLQPISVINGGISEYALLGALAFGEATEKGSHKSRATIKEFYDKYVNDPDKEKTGIKVDCLMRPVYGKRMIGMPGEKLKIVRSTDIGAEIDMYSSLGFAIELLSLSSYHKDIILNFYIHKNFLPPLRHQQIKLYLSSDGIPVALVTWARISEAVVSEIQLTGRSLELADWNCGEEFFFNDFVSPYGCTKSVISDLKYNVVPRGCLARSLRRNQNGTIRRVSRWVGRGDIESGDEMQKARASIDLSRL